MPCLVYVSTKSAKVDYSFQCLAKKEVSQPNDELSTSNLQVLNTNFKLAPFVLRIDAMDPGPIIM